MKIGSCELNAKVGDVIVFDTPNCQKLPVVGYFNFPHSEEKIPVLGTNSLIGIEVSVWGFKDIFPFVEKNDRPSTYCIPLDYFYIFSPIIKIIKKKRSPQF